MTGIDKQNNDDLDKQQKEKTIDSLKEFWEWNDKSDKKLLENQNWGKLVKWAVLENINKKLPGVNDPKTQEAISNLENQLNEIPDGPLSKENAQKLKNTYNKLNNLEAQEFAQDWEQAKDVQQKRDSWKKEYADKLDEAVEEMRKILKNNHEEAMNKQKQGSEKMQEARNMCKQEQGPETEKAECDINKMPPDVKESPTATT